MTHGWETKTLGDVAEINAGNSAPQAKSLFKDGTYPFFRTSDAGRVRFGSIYESADYLNDEGVRRLRRYPKGTILFPKSGASTFLNHRVMLGVEGCVSSHLAAIVADETQINPQFLLYFLSTVLAQDLVQDHSYPSLNLPTIAGISIPVPPLPEQQRIVGILDEAFEGVATARTNAEKNVQNARALFESHLQGVFADAWRTSELVTLSDLATDITDGDHMPPPKSKTGVPFITIGNIVKETREISFADTFMVPRSYFDRLKANRKPQKGDVLYTVTGSFGIPVIVKTNSDFCFQRHIGLVRPKPETISAWLYYLLLSPQVFKQASGGATGTAQKTVSLRLLRGLEVPKVALEEQRITVAKLDSLSAESQRLVTLYEGKLTALEALKRSMLHQAFAGQLAGRT
jgi:type I restriction enzyme, S subunit